MINISYNELKIIFDKITEAYPYFKMSYKKELYNNFSIDCGTDFARFILAEIIYNKDGESIY